jgi:hypothetical protein
MSTTLTGTTTDWKKNQAFAKQQAIAWLDHYWPTADTDQQRKDVLLKVLELLALHVELHPSMPGNISLQLGINFLEEGRLDNYEKMKDFIQKI